jgi:hypothetical protein
MRYPEMMSSLISEIKEAILRGYLQGHLHSFSVEPIRGNYPRISLRISSELTTGLISYQLMNADEQC